MKRKLSMLSLLAVLSASGTALASGPDAGLQMTQLGHRVWRVQDGTLPGEPTAMAQTPDGYLWIATANGLARFDGVNLKGWHEATGKNLPIPALSSLGVSTDGKLWLGTASVLYSIQPGTLELHKELGARINAIAKDPNGDLWAVRSRLGSDKRGPLCRLTPKIQCYGDKEGIKFSSAAAVAFTPSGEPWVGISGGLSAGIRANVRTYTIPTSQKQAQLANVSSLIVKDEEEAWAGVQQSGFGLQHFSRGKWNSIPIGGAEAKDVGISALYQDASGSLLIGTFGHGIYRVKDGKTEHYDQTSGLSGDVVRRFFEDSTQNLWVITQDGIDEFFQPRVARLTKTNGIVHGTATSLVERRNGEIWIGDTDRFDIISPDRAHSDRAVPVPSGPIKATLVDDQDRLWAGLGKDLAVFQGNVPHIVGHDVGEIIRIAQDDSHNLWIQTALPNARFFKVDPADKMTPVQLPFAKDAKVEMIIAGSHAWFLESGKSRLYSPDAESLTMSPDAASRMERYFSKFSKGSRGIWLATRRGEGLLRAGKIEFMTHDGGLVCDSIYTSVEDRQGDLWLFSACGLQRVRSSDIDAWVHDPNFQVCGDNFSARDGVSTASSPYFPDSLVTRDGRVWFVNESTALVLDPRDAGRPGTALPLLVESVSADHRVLSLAKTVEAPANTHDLQIAYTSLALREADQVSFRYRLLPFDPDWVEAGSRRIAYYTALPPGRYRFEVSARPPHGDWIPTPTTFDLRILPAFYQTLWFKLTLIGITILCIIVAFRLRVRNATAHMQRRLDSQMSERVRIARELHDTILQGFYGLLMRVQSAANRLPASEPARLAIEKSLDEAENTLREGRETIRELRGESNAEEDLLAALQAMAAGMALEGTNEVSYRVTGEKRRLHPLVRSEMLRVGREALWNALAHAVASRIEVVVAFDAKGITLSLGDNGVGMDPEVLSRGKRDGHWGLRGMKERSEAIGGSFQITSTPNVGTRVTLFVPASLAFVQSFPAGTNESLR